MTEEQKDEVHRLVQSVGVVQLSRVMFKDMDVSDHGCTIAKILGKEDVKDIGTEHLVKYAHSLALDLLEDKDGVYNIREYFLK